MSLLKKKKNSLLRRGINNIRTDVTASAGNKWNDITRVAYGKHTNTGSSYQRDCPSDNQCSV